MAKLVDPFKRELDWAAEWMGDRWWVVGLLESPWEAKFIAYATIWRGDVRAERTFLQNDPTKNDGNAEWIKRQAAQWGVSHLRSRLTPEGAKERISRNGLGGVRLVRLVRLVGVFRGNYKALKSWTGWRNSLQTMLGASLFM